MRALLFPNLCLRPLQFTGLPAENTGIRAALCSPADRSHQEAHMKISGPIAPTVLEKPQPPQRGPSDPSGGTEPGAGSTPPAAATDVSGHAQALGTLQSLSTTDPAKFKQAASGYADALKAQAAQAGGPQAEHFTTLALKFDKAAQTGSLDALYPHDPPVGTVQVAYAKNSLRGLHSPHAHYQGLAHGTRGKSVSAAPAPSASASVPSASAPDTSASVSNALRYTPPQA